MKHMTQILCIFALAISAFSSQAFAQTNTENSLLLTYITRNTDYKAALNQRAKRLFLLSNPSCETIDTTKRLKPTIIEPVQFSKTIQENNAPYYGQWIEHIQLMGCELTLQHNFLITAYNSGSLPNISPLLNGQSRIQPIDQLRAEKNVKQAIRNNGCSNASFVLGANFLGYKAKNQQAISQTNQNAGWFEEWIVDACDTTQSVNLAILPDAKTRIRFLARVKKETTTQTEPTK